MATVANITLNALDRLRALAKYSPGVGVEGRSNGYSIAYTYSPGPGWYVVVEIQDGNEKRRIEPDKYLDIGMGPCAEGCGRPGRVKYSGVARVVCMKCYRAITAETWRLNHGND
jgi:hypothetical protein